MTTLTTLAALFFISSTAAHKFSIVGYAPEDLTSIGKLIELFETWVAKHNKVYHSIEEKLERFEMFKDNLKHIDERNKESTEYWLGLNEFADMSHDEFRSKYLGLKFDQSSKSAALSEEFSYKDVVDVPKDVDWRKKGAVTPVKNQGQCGEYNFYTETEKYIFSYKRVLI